MDTTSPTDLPSLADVADDLVSVPAADHVLCAVEDSALLLTVSLALAL